MRYDLGEGGEQVRDVKDEDILYQLQAIAMADVTKLINVRDGTVEVSQTQQLPKKLRCAIAAIEKSAGGIKVKFYDKLKALELLGKYKGLFSGGSADRRLRKLLFPDCRTAGIPGAFAAAE